MPTLSATPDQIQRLSDIMDKVKDPSWFEALVLCALDQSGGDLNAAIDAAMKAIEVTPTADGALTHFVSNEDSHWITEEGKHILIGGAGADVAKQIDDGLKGHPLLTPKGNPIGGGSSNHPEIPEKAPHGQAAPGSILAKTSKDDYNALDHLPPSRYPKVLPPVENLQHYDKETGTIASKSVQSNILPVVAKGPLAGSVHPDAATDPAGWKRANFVRGLTRQHGLDEESAKAIQQAHEHDKLDYRKVLAKSFDNANQSKQPLSLQHVNQAIKDLGGSHVGTVGGGVQPSTAGSSTTSGPVASTPSEPAHAGASSPGGSGDRPASVGTAESVSSAGTIHPDSSIAPVISPTKPAYVKPTGPSDKELRKAAKQSPEQFTATQDEVNHRIDRFANLFRAKGLHEQAAWMNKLKDHVNSVGVQGALDSLGDKAVKDKNSVKGISKGIMYDGPQEQEDLSSFINGYLGRHGITVLQTERGNLEKGKRLISSLAPEFQVAKQSKGDFAPSSPQLKHKLAEAKALPGLEGSRDLNGIMGGKVTHLTPDIMSKLDDRYGKGKWIVKSYGDEASAGYGIFFPQRAAQVKQDANNTIYNAGSNIAKYGFSLDRDKDGNVDGIKHEGGDVYKFGTDKYKNTIDGDVRHWADQAHAASANEKGAALPPGKFMAQPAFNVVGVSDAERAAGKTIVSGEGRVHVVARDGKAVAVPHSTWIKGEHLPVVFENEDTRAMAKAAVDAINAMPASERKNHVYAPDVIKTDQGYRVVEANPSNNTGTSGYLGNNPLIIDSFVSHLTGRDPAHVQFIRNLLTSKHPTTNLSIIANAYTALTINEGGNPNHDQLGRFATGEGESVSAWPPTKEGATKSKMVAARREGVGKESKVVLRNGEPAPEHIKPSMIPPNWTHVKIGLDPDADVLVQARDKAGRAKTVYSDSFHLRNAAIKWARTREGLKQSDAIHEQNQSNRKNPDLKEDADCTWLMREQGTRPGSDSDTKAKVKAFGATTLLGDHVKPQPDGGVRLQFIGKEGVYHDHLIRNPDLAKMLVERKNTSEERGGKLFATNYDKVAAYASTLDGGKFSPKDWRTTLANKLAIAEIAKDSSVPAGMKEYKARVKAVGTVVSHVLGNKPAQAIESYVDPVLFSPWRVAGHISPGHEPPEEKSAASLLANASENQHWITEEGRHILIGGPTVEASKQIDDGLKGHPLLRSNILTASTPQPIKQKFTVEQKEALQHYQGPGYQDINSALLNTEHGIPISPHINKIIKHMDSAIEESPGLPKPTTLYRGVNARLVHGAKVGDKISSAGYQSTSLDKRTTENFSAHTLKISAPAGIKGAYIDHDQFHGKKEEEYILPRGISFRITHIEPKPDYGNVYHVEIVNHRPTTNWEIVTNAYQSLLDNSNPNHDEHGRFSAATDTSPESLKNMHIDDLHKLASDLSHHANIAVMRDEDDKPIRDKENAVLAAIKSRPKKERESAAVIQEIRKQQKEEKEREITATHPITEPEQPPGPMGSRKVPQTDIRQVKPTTAAGSGERVQLKNGHVYEYKGISGYAIDNKNRINGWERLTTNNWEIVTNAYQVLVANAGGGNPNHDNLGRFSVGESVTHKGDSDWKVVGVSRSGEKAALMKDGKLRQGVHTSELSRDVVDTSGKSPESNETYSHPSKVNGEKVSAVPISELSLAEDIFRKDLPKNSPDRLENEQRAEGIVKKYMKKMKSGETISPVTAYRNEFGKLEVIDGHHRYEAAKRLGYKKIPVFVDPTIGQGSASAVDDSLKSHTAVTNIGNPNHDEKGLFSSGPSAAHLPSDEELKDATVTKLKTGTIHENNLRKVTIGDKNYFFKGYDREYIPEINGKNDLAISHLSSICGLHTPACKEATVNDIKGTIHEWTDARTMAQVIDSVVSVRKTIDSIGKVPIEKQLLLNYLCSIGDRHVGNYMITSASKLVSIDHEFSFGHTVLGHSGMHPLGEGASIVDNDQLRDLLPRKHTFSQESISHIADKIPDIIKALKGRGMEKEANDVAKRGKVVTKLVGKKDASIEDLIKAGEKHGY
jgi:DNA topoisomerase IB